MGFHGKTTLDTDGDSSVVFGPTNYLLLPISAERESFRDWIFLNLSKQHDLLSGNFVLRRPISKQISVEDADSRRAQPIHSTFVSMQHKSCAAAGYSLMVSVCYDCL
jgi:hypothetical protein